MTPNGPFYLSQPEPGDNRPRNSFGILIGFGQAYSEYYNRRDADILIENDSGMYVFTPQTDAGREWIAENVSTEPWQHLGESFACDDRRTAMDIAQGALNDGLNVE